MRKWIILCALLITFAVVASSCSSGGKNEAEIVDETPKAWSASDKSLHTAKIIPLKERSGLYQCADLDDNIQELGQYQTMLVLLLLLTQLFQ